MPKQDRAIRTRQSILLAAAEVFDQHGYQATTIAEIINVAGVTKGALYFHFDSKEDLAQGILGEQDLQKPAPPQPIKIQELIDVGMVHAHRLQTNPLVRAGVRLTLDQQAEGLDRRGPFLRWSEATLALLTAAKEQGELLPHVRPDETADLYVGAFAGVQSMSHAMTAYADLGQRVQCMQRHILPSICAPAVLACLDLSPERGARITAQLEAPSWIPDA